MGARFYFLNTLKPGVDAQEYEDWIRRVDYPVARRQPAIERYDVTRIEARMNSDEAPPCQYLEVVDVTSVEEYRGSLDGNAELELLLAEWAQFVDSTIVYGEVIT